MKGGAEMKKAYQKPVMEFENFRLDVEIASGNYIYENLRQTFVDINRREPYDDAEFQQFIREQGGLDANDGWCYFSAISPRS